MKLPKKYQLSMATGLPGDTWHMPPSALMAGSATILFAGTLPMQVAVERGGPCCHCAWRHAELARRLIILPTQPTVARRHIIMPPQPMVAWPTIDTIMSP
jgi:hypothetical protein